MNSKQFEQVSKLSWVLTLLLVAVTAFVLGQNLTTFKASQPDDSIPATSEPTNSAISAIEQAIQEDTSTAVDNAASQPTGLISLNSATLAELDKLPGIGPSKAQAIIDYRQQNGQFVRIEDLMNVKGIGQKTFDSLKGQISL
jgi:comEA protein